MPHNLAWHDWEMHTRVQRANREVERIRQARMASEPSGADKNRSLNALLTKLRGLPGLGVARAAEAAKGA